MKYILGAILRSDQSKNDGEDQWSIQSSTTPDPQYHMGKRQKTQ